MISTQSSQRGFVPNQSDLEEKKIDLSSKKKKEIGLDDYGYRNIRIYGEFQSEDFSFLLKTPQESANDMDIFKQYSRDVVKEIKWSWKDFGEIPKEFTLQNNTPWYTPLPLDTTNNWWYCHSVPNVGSIWLFCIALLSKRRKR